MPDVDKEWARFEQEVISKGTRRSPALAWALGIGIAASVALLLLFNKGKEQTKQVPLIAQTEEIKPQPMPQPVREEVQVKEQEVATKTSTPVIAQNKRLASRNANAPATSSLDIPAREYTGAVQNFRMSDMGDLAFESVDQALQGQIAGLDVVQSSNKLVKDTTHGGIEYSKEDSFLVVVNGKKLFDSRGMTSEEIDRRIEKYLREYAEAVKKFDMKEVEGLAFESVDQALQEQIAGQDIASAGLASGTTMRLRGTEDYRPSDKDRMDSTLILVNGEPLPEHLQREVLGNDPDDLDTYVPRYFYQQHQLLDEVYVHKDSEFTEKFGERAKYGVIELKTVPDTYCDDYVKAHPKLMKKYSRVEGYIVDDNGKPLTEAWVHVKWERSKLLKYPYFVGAATDSTGHYAIWLPTRDITLCAVHPGYKSVEFSPADKTLAVRLPKINKSNMNMRLRGNSQEDEIVVSVNADGNADGGHQFEKSEDDENTFCIDGIYYTVTDDGNLRVTDYDEDSFSGIATIFSVLKYQGKTMEVVDIGNEAFQRCTNLTSITIPGSVTSIGGSAFWGCSNLTSITIPESVTSIGYVAFDGCTSLTSVTIPNSVTRIAESAFSGCESLTSVTIPESVTSIEFGVFGYCSSLTSVTIPNSVIRIEGSAFRECNSLTSITIPESVTSIGWYAFYGCKSLASIIIPESVTSIGEATFKGCSSLTDVYCHAENVPETNSNAFNNSSIEKATLHVPAGSVTKYKTIAPWKNFKSIVAIE